MQTNTLGSQLYISRHRCGCVQVCVLIVSSVDLSLVFCHALNFKWPTVIVVLSYSVYFCQICLPANGFHLSCSRRSIGCLATASTTVGPNGPFFHASASILGVSTTSHRQEVPKRQPTWCTISRLK